MVQIFKIEICIKLLIRSLIFPIFYKISEIALNFRKVNIFSTDLLKKFISKKTIKKSNFNFVVKNFLNKKILKKIKKKIDFLIYYRKHKNKSTFFHNISLKKLSN